MRFPHHSSHRLHPTRGAKSTKSFQRSLLTASRRKDPDEQLSVYDGKGIEQVTSCISKPFVTKMKYLKKLTLWGKEVHLSHSFVILHPRFSSPADEVSSGITWNRGSASSTWWARKQSEWLGLNLLFITKPPARLPSNHMLAMTSGPSTTPTS